MTKTLRWVSVVTFIFVYVACAPVEFSTSKEAGGGPGIIHPGCSSSITPGYCPEDYTVPVEGPKVDILFVNDNSASMSFEQKALASRFAGFIQNLDARFVDYRIGITTTDISDGNNPPRAINGHGTLQNGNLISFGSSMPYLTKTVSDRITRFNSTIVRGETKTCENYIADNIASISTAAYEVGYKQNCPSGDERGVYAANLTITNNPSGFMRSDAYLAIIFLADEDVRSGFYCNGPNNTSCNPTGFPLESNDQPAALTASLSAKGKDRVAEIHTITVKDQNCLSQQNNQTLSKTNGQLEPATTGLVKGSIGSIYQTFGNAGWGDSLDICSLNYSSGLEAIANKIAANKGYVLKCANPINLQVIPLPNSSGFSYSRSGNSITVTNPPVGGQIRFVYECPNSN